MTLLLSNLRLKLLALGFAAVFWGMVAYSENPVRTNIYKLAFLDRPQLPSKDLTIMGDLPEIPVKVLAPAETLRTLDSRSLRLAGDFSSVHAGLNRVRIWVDSPDPGLRLDYQDSISVTVDEKATVSQTVVIETVHSVPEGFHVVSMAANPDKVTVVGPKSLLNGIRAVVPVDLSGKQEPFPSPLTKVVVQDADRKPLKLTVDPPEVSVKVTIQADTITVTKGVGFSLTGQPANGYRVTNAQVTPLTVTVTGLAAILEGLTQVSADPVDITNATADVVRTVNLRPPAGVTPSVKTVQVRVSIARNPQVSPTAAPTAP